MVDMAEERQRNDSGQYAGTLSEEQVLEAVGDMDHVATTSEVADAIGKSIDTARRWLNNLHDDGKVDKKEVGARGVVWWVETEDDGDDDDDDMTAVRHLQLASKESDDAIYAGGMVFDDGTLAPDPDPPYHSDALTKRMNNDAVYAECRSCGDYRGHGGYVCLNCDTNLTPRWEDTIREDWEADGWHVFENEGNIWGRDALCPDCQIDGKRAVEQAKAEGLVHCALASHTRHRPGSDAFDDCYTRGHIPLTEGQYEEVMDTCT